MDKIIKFIRRDWVRKIVALSFAILIFSLLNEKIKKEIAGVKVSVECPEELVNLGEIPPISLLLSGSKNVLNDLKPQQIKGKAKVLSKNYTPQVPYSLRLSKKDFETPLGVSIVQIEPAELLLNLDQTAKKSVPVKVVFANLNKLSKDYKITRTQTTPEEVVISGPKSVIEKIKEVQTQGVPLDESVNSSFEYTALLTPLELIKFSGGKVNCLIEIERQFSDKKISNVPINIEYSPEIGNLFKFALVPRVCEVELSGPASQISFIKASDLRVLVNAGSIDKEGDYFLNLKCYIDNFPEVQVRSITPGKTTLNVRK